MTVLAVGFIALALGVAAGRRGVLEHAEAEMGDGLVGTFIVLAALVFAGLFILFAWVDYKIGFDNWLTQLFAAAGAFKKNLPYCGGTADLRYDIGANLVLAIEGLFGLFMLLFVSWFIVVLPPLGALCGFFGAFRWLFTGKSGLLRFGGWSLGIGAALILIWDLWIQLCILTQQYPWGCRGAV